MISRFFKWFLWLLILALLFALTRYWNRLDGRVAAACMPVGVRENGGILDQLARLQEAVLRLQELLNAPVDSLDVLAENAAAARPSPGNGEGAPPAMDGKLVETEMLRMQACISRLNR